MTAMLPSEFLPHRRYALQQAYEILALNVAEADKALAALAASGNSASGAGGEARPDPHPSAEASQQQDVQADGRKAEHPTEGVGNVAESSRASSSALAPPTAGGLLARPGRESAAPPPVPLPGHAPQLYSLAMQLRGLYLQRATVRRGLQQLYSSHLRMQIGDGRTVQKALTPRLPEPTRRRAHPDAVLEEMQWLATDVYQERRWKIAMAKILARQAAEVVNAPGSKWRGERAETVQAARAEAAAHARSEPADVMMEDSPLAAQARSRSISSELLVARVMSAGDVPGAAMAAMGEGKVETALLRTVPYAVVAKEATALLGPIWDTLRRAAFALCCTSPSAWATFPLLNQREKRDGLMAFRPLGTGAAAVESFNGLPFALGSQSLIVLSSALAGAASAWVADGQGQLASAVAQIQSQEEAGSVGAVMDATLRGKPILRGPQSKVAQRVVCSWLVGSPAIVEGFTTSRGLGRTSTVAAAVAAMHARHRATQVGKPAVSIVVCAGVSLHSWCAALTRFAPGLRVLPVASASAVEAVSVAVKGLTAGQGAVIVYAVHDSGSVSSLPRLVGQVSSLSTGRSPVSLLTCCCDHRAMRVAQQGASSATLVSVQGVTSILADSLPASSFPSVSRCLLTTRAEELPKDDPTYLADLSRFLLPLQQGGVKEGKHALDSVRRLAILSERTSAISASGGPSGDGTGSGGAMEVEGTPHGPEGPVGSTALSETEMDASVRGAMNRALWLLYVVMPGESEAGEGVGKGGPGGSSPIAVPTTSIPGSGQFGAPDRQERTILAVHSIAQSTAQTRIVRCSQVRTLQSGDVTGLYVTYLLASTYRFPLAHIKPEIHSKLYKGPAIDVEWPFVPLPGLPSPQEGDAGAPTLPSQTSPQCLRLLAALSAACQHATPWLGLRADSRPDYASGHPLLAGEWYGAVNSVMPRLALHAMEGGRYMKVKPERNGTGLKAARVQVHAVHQAAAVSSVTGLPSHPGQEEGTADPQAWLVALALLHAETLGRGLGGGGQCIVGTATVQRWQRGVDGSNKAGAGVSGKPAAASVGISKKGTTAASTAAAAPATESEAQSSLFSLRCAIHLHVVPMDGHAAGAAVGGRKCTRSQVRVGREDPLPRHTRCNLHVQGAHSRSLYAMATLVSRLHSARDAWSWLGMVGPHPQLQAVHGHGTAGAGAGPRIWPAEQPKESSTRDVAHRMLLRSGKLRVLSSILSECSALGHVPLLLGHTGEAVLSVQMYLNACGIPFVRLDAGTADGTGLWPAEASARFTALSGVRRGLVGLACCALPSWVHKLEDPKSVTLALETILGPAARLHPSLVDAAVVLDYPPSLQAGTLLESLLSKLRYGRSLPVTRMRAHVSLEDVMLTGAAEVMHRGIVLDHTDRAIIPRVLQPFLGYSEVEIEERTEELLLQEAQARRAGAQGAEKILEQAMAQRMTGHEAVVVSACTGVGACPRDRHLCSPTGQAMVRRYAARKSAEAKGGIYSYDVAGHAGGDAQEDAMYDADVRSFGAIECNTGRHIYAPAIRPPLLHKHRHLQRRHAASIRAAIDVLARHQDEGGLHFSHAYGPPNPNERKVHRPPGTHADRGASETARHVARITMDVIPGDITILHGAKAAQHPVPSSAMNAPAPPMPWRTSNAARRALQLQVLAEKEKQQAMQAGGARLGVGSGGASTGAGAGGAAMLSSVGPIPLVPSVQSFTRQYTWTRLTTRAMYTADMPFVTSMINVTGDTTSSMVTYAGPAPIQTTQDQVRRLLPSTLWDDMRFIQHTLGRSEAERRGRYICKCPSGLEGVPDFEYSMEPLEPESSADVQQLHKSIRGNWERYSTGIRVRAGDLVLRPLAEQAGILSLARKRFRVLIQGGDEGMQSVKRAKLALGLPGESTHASEVLRIGVRDASDDGAGSIVMAGQGMPWTPAEDLALLRAVAQYGNNWSLIQEAMRGSTVSHLLPATMSYNYSLTLVTQAEGAQAQARGKYQFVPQISPLSNNRMKTTRSVRALFSRFRLWVHRPVHVAATVTLPAPPSLGSSTSHGHAHNAKTTERSVVVRVLPGAQGSWKERSSMDVVPVTAFKRRVGADQLLSLHIRGPSSATSLHGQGEDKLAIGIGQPVRAVVKDLSASDVTLDAPAKRVTVSNLSKSVAVACMKANDADPADPLTREAPKPHPQQRHFIPSTEMAKAVDPEVSLVLVNARSMPAGDASLLAATQSSAAMTRAPSVVAAHAPPHQAAMVAANVSSIVARKDWQELSVNAYVQKFAERAPAGPGLGLPPSNPAGDTIPGAPTSLGPVKPVGAAGVLVPPVPAAFNVHSISSQQAIQPYKAKGAWLTSIGPYAQMLSQAQAQAAQAAAAAAGAAQGHAPAAAAARRAAPTSAEYIAAQFDALARKYLMSLKEVLAHEYSKRGMDYLPWLSYILKSEDKSTIVAAYSNLELDESKRIDIVTDLIVARTNELEAQGQVRGK